MAGCGVHVCMKKPNLRKIGFLRLLHSYVQANWLRAKVLQEIPIELFSRPFFCPACPLFIFSRYQ